MKKDEKPNGRRAVLRLAAALGATATVGVLTADRLGKTDGGAPAPGRSPAGGAPASGPAAVPAAADACAYAVTGPATATEVFESPGPVTA
ncbi:hypothetical protein [Streptomyces sp. MS191]|uniref:hypothetical protein n=1 Tax=Streptomyces sp. ms191 TaxID=1827978 RepID=UPI0021CA9F93|nr:hypothetical protein [Streptomyces sp. ms191]